MNEKKILNTITRTIILFALMLSVLSCAHNPPQPQISFEELSANLNTPQLINKYQKRHFEWASNAQGGGCVGVNGIVDIGVNLAACPPSFIFNNNGKGNCGAFTTFAVYCLRKAGYEAYPLYVYEEWPDWLAPGHQPRDYHIMTLYRDNGRWFTLDNGHSTPKGIKGPFNNIKDLPYEVLRVDKQY